MRARWIETLAPWFTCGLLAGVVGCQGTVAETSRGGPDTGSGASSQGGQGGMTAQQCATATTQPGPSPIRRLTIAEYNNTVHDLLNDETAPGDAFPGETQGLGFTNNADSQSASDLLIEAYETAATNLATVATADLPKLLACDPAAQGEDACMLSFLQSFGLKAYRRPLTADEVTRLTALYQTSKTAYGFQTGVRLVLQAILQTPEFLYRVESMGSTAVSRLTGYEIASRLSYLVWSSMPDPTLFDAAASGGLDNDDGVVTQVRRLLADPRANQGVSSFFSQWLYLERLDNTEKNLTLFPTFTPAVRGLLRQEVDLFISDVFFSGGTLQNLLLGNYSFMNKDLAAYYGVAGPTGDAFEKVTLDPTKRAGLLTQGALLAGYAKVNRTAPVERGLFVRARFLCNPPGPPPAGVPVLEEDPTLTERERMVKHRADPACAGCHTLMDPIGFGFEHFDAIGLFRDNENDAPVDATGELTSAGDIDGAFNGASELATKLAQGTQVRECMVTQWFRYGYGRSESDYDSCTLRKLNTAFAESGGNLKELVVTLTTTDAFLYRSNEGGSP